MSSIKRMSGLEISLAVSEINQQLVGLRVLNVYSINKRTYLIKLSGTNPFYPSTTKQYLIIESGVRIHITDFERELDSTPNGLATAIRKQLKGKTLTGVEQSGLDRVVKLSFGIGATAMNLFIELYGTGNIVFCDNELNIVALLKQQAYGSSLLGATPNTTTATPTTTDSAIGLNQTATATNAVTLRSKYQWQDSGSNGTESGAAAAVGDTATTALGSLPAQIDTNFVLDLFKNKHQRLLEQEQAQEAAAAAAVLTPPPTNGKSAKSQRQKSKPSQTTVKQVLYESVLGPQLCLHGCSQFDGLDIGKVYTTVFTDQKLLEKLVRALQLGLDHYKTMVSDRSGYLHCRLTSVVTEGMGVDKKGAMGSKCDENVITVDFSPGNLSQTTISQTIYLVPGGSGSVATPTAPSQPPGDNNNNSANPTIVNTTSGENGPLEVLMTTNACANKISPDEAIAGEKNGQKIMTKLFKTFQMPENGYQTFNWGIVAPTSVTQIVTDADEDGGKKKKKWQQQQQPEQSDEPPQPKQPPQQTITTTVKDVWFYSPRFSVCVDTYYGTKEVEKEAQRMGREKINVLSKIEKTRQEQFSKLQTLQQNIDTMLIKAQLIENNQSWIQQSINAVQQQLSRGLDWFLVADLIKQQKGLLNPLALLIDKLEFSSQSMIVTLSWELEHISVLIQNEVIKRNAEMAKRQQEHIIAPVGAGRGGNTTGSNNTNDDDFSDEDDEDEDGEDDEDDGEDEEDNDQDQDDDIIVDDVEDAEGVEAAREDRRDDKKRDNAPGSWKKPIKVTIDLTQTAFANAQVYYSHVKELTRKRQVAEQFSEQTIKSIEKKGQKELHQVKEIQAKQRRKVLWFEKFYWFISSENFLIIGGRDATQNELLVKRYLDTNDFYYHADLHGASSVVVKVPNSYVQAYQTQFPGKPLVLPQQTLYEAAGFTTCHSNAWVNKTNNTRAYWVYAHQVSKTPPTGMYLEKGSFIIRGKKNYIEPQPLQMGIGLLFRCGDDETIANHVGERSVRSMGSGTGTGGADEDGGDSTTTGAKKTSAFEEEQNRRQQDQEETIARLEREAQERQKKKLQIQSLKQQKSGLGNGDGDETTAGTTTTTTDDQQQSQQPQAKKILSKNDRYQMKKLGITDSVAYWTWKEDQAVADKRFNNDKNKNSDTKGGQNGPDGDGPESDDDVDETGQVPSWLQKSKAKFGGSDDDDEDNDGDGLGDDEDEDGEVPDWLQKSKAQFGSDLDSDGEDDEDEDGEAEEEEEVGSDVDETGRIPSWLQKAKDKFGGSDLESDEDQDEDDNEDDDNAGDDEDENGQVPQWLQKSKAKLGGSDDDADDSDDDDDDDEPIPTATKPAHLRAQQQQPTKDGQQDKKQQQQQSQPQAKGKNTTNDKKQPQEQQQQSQRGGKKNNKGNKSKGFDSDDGDDVGAFDPLKYLPKSKKHLMTAFELSSDDDSGNKKPQHGVNRKKGNTKEARAARQEAVKRAEEETKVLKAKQAEERNKAHLAKVAAKREARKEQQNDLRAAAVAAADDNTEIIPSNDFDDDEDEFNELGLQRQQQQRAEVEGTDLILSTLTTKPTITDYITHAIPVVAPYSALMDYPFKVKLVPGGGKKGQTIKDSTHVLMQAVQALYKHPPLSNQISNKKTQAANANIIPLDKLPEEEQALIQKEKQFQALLSSLIKQVGDNEFSLVMISNAKVSVQGIQQVHKQQKQQRKQNAKQKEKK